MIAELKHWFASHPEYLWVGVGLVFLFVVISIRFKHRYFYEKKAYLASRSEQKLFKNLLLLLPKDYQIHCQVSMISLLKPADLRSARMVWAKRMDYVITDETTKILLVIELDDKSHERKDRKVRDKFVNKTLKGKHTLLRIKTEQAQDLSLLRKQLQSALDKQVQ